MESKKKHTPAYRVCRYPSAIADQMDSALVAHLAAVAKVGRIAEEWVPQWPIQGRIIRQRVHVISGSTTSGSDLYRLAWVRLVYATFAGFLDLLCSPPGRETVEKKILETTLLKAEPHD